MLIKYNNHLLVHRKDFDNVWSFVRIDEHVLYYFSRFSKFVLFYNNKIGKSIYFHYNNTPVGISFDYDYCTVFRIDTDNPFEFTMNCSVEYNNFIENILYKFIKK